MNLENIVHMTGRTQENIYHMQADICRALSNPIRLRILDLLADGEMNSTQLLKFLKITKGNLSQHVNLLKIAGLIHERRDGTYYFLRLSTPQVQNVCDTLRDVVSRKIVVQERIAMQPITRYSM